MKNYIVIRYEKYLQHNHMKVKAKSKKEALEIAKKGEWENAEYTLLSEKYRVEVIP